VDYLDEAIKIAKRSTIRTHKTGAVIVIGDEIVSNGWSHTPNYRLSNGKRSMHAEMHALARARHIHLQGAEIYVATLSGKSGNRVNACPCLDCAVALRSAMLFTAFYTVRESTNYLSLIRNDTFAGLKVYPQS
jgi:pyrimidine deaminase RibD-like protein